MKKILVFILCVAGMTASVMAQGNLGYAGRLSNHSYTGSVAGQVFSVNQPTSLAAGPSRGRSQRHRSCMLRLS